MSRVIEIDTKTRTFYFFNGIINIENVDPNDIKIDKKLFKNILIYYVFYVTLSSMKPLYLTINNANEYIEESNRNKIWH